MNRFAALPLSLLLFAGTALGETPAVTAPYGLSWGQSQAEVTALGVTLSDCSTKDETTVCDAAGVPQPETRIGVDFYRVRFKPDRGLVAVSLASTSFTADPEGTKGKAAYEEVRKTIAAVYGEGAREEKINQVMPYMAPNEFYECLDFEGCGTWRSEWADGNVAISLNGLEAGKGYMLIHTYRPL